ncbi:F510_1955 family glycosylhydrolase [Pseudarthrobacter sp. P1]|uniref:F510_1955 family glycosylhydrolase n=1 Tax=Pseudarthrobacter sp. P1 TaxID=3418418 RepID=UPI003CF50DB1
MTSRTPIFPTRKASAVALLALPLVLAGCSTGAPAADPSPAATGGHVHGISVDPMSTRILLATHDGLFDATSKAPVKISDTIDLMGFTPTGDPTVFYASGHPGPGSTLPNPAGLIRSTDSGKTWAPVSRQGQSDFHALTSTNTGLVAYDGTLLTSPDGTTWTPATAAFTPAVLAGSPTTTVVLATTQNGLQRSTDGGKTWQSNSAAPLMQFAAFAASADKAAIVAAGVAPDGTVYVSTDAGVGWVQTGRISGQVNAITAMEGTPGKPWIWASTTTGVQVSTDGGATFRPATP